jgi:hypothetical protein
MAQSADYWQGRAEQTRLIAQHVDDPVIRAELLGFAAEYESLERDCRTREAADQAELERAQKSFFNMVARMTSKGQA